MILCPRCPIDAPDVGTLTAHLVEGHLVSAADAFAEARRTAAVRPTNESGPATNAVTAPVTPPRATQVDPASGAVSTPTTKETPMPKKKRDGCKSPPAAHLPAASPDHGEGRAAMSAETLTLRQRAIESARTQAAKHALAAQQEQDRHAAKRMRELFVWLTEQFGVDPADITPRWNAQALQAEAVVDGLLFVLPSKLGLRVMLPCRRCSIPLAVEVYRTENLGYALDGAEKREHRGCPAIPPPRPEPEPPPAALSTSERLLAILDEYIAERMPVQQ